MGTSCKLQIVLLFVSSLACSWAALPYDITPCAQDDKNLNMCVLKMAEDALNYVKAGYSELLGRVNPFTYTDFKMDLKTDDLELKIRGKDMLWHGLSATTIRNLKIDLKEMKMSFILIIPSIKIDGTCTVNGHIGDLLVQADGERFPYATILMSNTDEFSATFNFNLKLRFDASGIFLIPVLTSYNPFLSVGTVTMENVFRVGYVPDQHKVDLLKKVEEAAAKGQRDFLVKIIGKLVAGVAAVIMQMDEYPQFFPFSLSVGSAPAVTGGWLMVILIIGISTLLKSI